VAQEYVCLARKPTRDEHRARLHALLEDALDYFDDVNPEGYDLGVVALTAELKYEVPLSSYLKRSEAGYTPNDDVDSVFTYWTSDHRYWVTAAMFRDAYLYAKKQADASAESDAQNDDESEDEGED
jgi:hypothetical protein